MISVQLGISVDEAFIRLRARAFAENQSLSELAADVVARRIRFDNEGTR
jgi:AmiR/NasT family two-component response regulator